MKAAKMNLHIYTVSKGGCAGSSVILLSFPVSAVCGSFLKEESRVILSPAG